MLVNIPYIEHMGNGFINQLIIGQSLLVLARCYRLAQERCLLVDVSHSIGLLVIKLVTGGSSDINVNEI